MRGTPTRPAASSVLLRVYHADPFQPADVRAAERVAIANAYDMLLRLPSHECIVACRDFFPNEDESQYVLVLEDVTRRRAAAAPDRSAARPQPWTRSCG